MLTKSKEWGNIIEKKTIKFASKESVSWIFEILGWDKNARRIN